VRPRLKSTNILKRLLTFTVLLLIGSAATALGQNHLVISQVYGAGGNGDPTKGTAATYRYDYVELYNPTNADISLSGYSVQYSAAATKTGNFSGVAVLTSTKSVQAHHYYLVQLGSQAALGADLPAPDDQPTSAPNISGTAGKVALVSSTAPLSAATCSSTALVDLFGYSSSSTTASCSETSPYLPPSGTVVDNTTAFARKDPSVDTDNNLSDFTVVSATPHNSSFTAGGGSTTSLSIASAIANPSTVSAGGAVTFSVTVTPGSASQGINSVVADLSSIGGSATQAFTLSSTANIYTYQGTVSASTGASSYSLPVAVKDADGESASGTIAIVVQSPATNLSISTIQANRSTYVGGKISTTGVVTLVIDKGFYIQTPSANPGSSGVSEGLYLFYGAGKVPSTAVVGNNVTVTGNLTLFPAATASHTPALELDSAAACPYYAADTNSEWGYLSAHQVREHARCCAVHDFCVWNRRGLRNRSQRSDEIEWTVLRCPWKYAASIPRTRHGLPRLPSHKLPDCHELYGDPDQCRCRETLKPNTVRRQSRAHRSRVLAG
jgi:uncharacterized protein